MLSKQNRKLETFKKKKQTNLIVQTNTTMIRQKVMSVQIEFKNC